MSTSSVERTSPSGKGTPSRAATGQLATAQGKTTIAESVVEKIAGIAARQVSGVYGLGGGRNLLRGALQAENRLGVEGVQGALPAPLGRAVGAVKEGIAARGTTPDLSQGVSVEVGERQAAVDLSIVVEYGVAIADVADAVRRNIIASVQRMTGLEVTEVNIAVNDIHLPSDDRSDDSASDSSSPEPRVQ